MTAPKAKNLVSGTLAESITTSTTNILVTIAQNIGASGIQAFFPTPPFYITIMPKSPIIGVANRLDSEIMLITAVSHDQVGNAALTATRAQRDTTAKAFSAGDIVTVGVYADDAVFLDDAGTSAVPTPWINNGDIVNNTIASNKLSNTENMVLVDSFRLSDTTNMGSFTLTIPDALVTRVEEAVLTFCLANGGNVSEYIRFFVNTTSPEDVETKFFDQNGAISSNNTNCGACIFPTTKVLCGGEFRVISVPNSWQKLGWYQLYGASWWRTGNFTVSTSSIPGIKSIIGVINNGSALPVRYGSWAKLYVRLKEE